VHGLFGRVHSHLPGQLLWVIILYHPPSTVLFSPRPSQTTGAIRLVLILTFSVLHFLPSQLNMREIGKTVSWIFLFHCIPFITSTLGVLTTTPPSQQIGSSRAWHFPLVLVADRSAAFRGESCGSRTQRTASEAWEFVSKEEKLSKGWWDPIRTSVARFAGAENVDFLPAFTDRGDLTTPERIVITYISRQGGNRRALLQPDHKNLVHALNELVVRKNAEKEVKGKEWEFNVVQAETLTKDEQVKIAARTTVRLRFLLHLRAVLLITVSFRYFLACMVTDLLTSS
jgi:hypothetical protein